MQTYQSNDGMLRKVLLANGIFSAFGAIACLLAAPPLAGLLFAKSFTVLGTSPAAVILELGIGLALFGGFVIWTARQRRLSLGRAKLVTFMDLSWVAGSALLSLAFAEYLSFAGQVVIWVVAGIVLLFAVDQMLGMLLTYRGRRKVKIDCKQDRMTLSARIATTAAPARVWQVMREQETYAEVAETLSRVEVLTGKGEGMQRRCTDNRSRSWQETCTLWDEGRAFGFRVHTEAADYPYPISGLSGKWSLNPLGKGTEVKMVFQVRAKAGLFNRCLFKLMAAPFSSVSDRLLSNWVRIMETAEPTAGSEENEVWAA